MASFEVSTARQVHVVVSDYWDLSAEESWFDFFEDEEAVFRIKASDVRWIRKLPPDDSGPAVPTV